MKILALLSLLFLSLQALQTGQNLPTLSLEKDEGGSVDGRPFSSETLTDKVHVIFYVDPDEKDLNNPFSDALKAEDFDRSRFASVAVINMDATWLPNIALDSALEEKQEQFPDTLYVKDLHKKGVEVWRVADDNSDVIITDKAGKVLYVYEGKVPKKDFGMLIQLIKENL